MLFKKVVVVWGKTATDVENAAEDAVTAARETPDVQAFGIHQESYAVRNPEADPHYAPSVSEVLG